MIEEEDYKITFELLPQIQDAGTDNIFEYVIHYLQQNIEENVIKYKVCPLPSTHDWRHNG